MWTTGLLLVVFALSVAEGQGTVLTISCVGNHPCVANIFNDTAFQLPFTSTTNSGSLFDLRLDSTNVVNGTNSLRVFFDYYRQLDSYFYVSTLYPWYAADYTELEFWVKATSNSAPANYFKGLYVAAYNGDLPDDHNITVPFNSCAPGNPTVWQKCVIKFTDLMPQAARDPKTLVSRIYFVRDASKEPFSLTFNMDDIRLRREEAGASSQQPSAPLQTSGDDRDVSDGSRKEGGLSAGAIAGISVAGSVVFLLLVALLIVGVFLLRRRRSVPAKLEVPSTPISQSFTESRGNVALESPSVTPVGPSNQSLQSSQSFASGMRTEKWHIPFDEIVFGDSIGAGAFGEVYVATWRDSKVAVKILTGLVGDEALAAFRKEADIMAALRPHKNVIQFLGISTSSPHYCIVLEFAEGGSLHNYLAKCDKLTPKQVLDLTKGVAAGMLHLSKERIVHRDLAARNVLLDGQRNPKISDFGMSRCLELSSQGGQTKTYVGPVRWMSPESIKTHEYSEKSDVWAFGILVWECLMRQEPYLKRDPLEVALEIRERNMTPEIPKDTHPLFVQLMVNCWKPKAADRPTFDDVSYFLQEAKL